MTSIEEVLDEAGEWVSIDGVEAVAQARQDGQDCIQVLASCSRDDLAEKIPSTFRGYPVVIVERQEKFTIERES